MLPSRSQRGTEQGVRGYTPPFPPGPPSDPEVAQLLTAWGFPRTLPLMVCNQVWSNLCPMARAGLRPFWTLGNRKMTDDISVYQGCYHRIFPMRPEEALLSPELSIL